MCFSRDSFAAASAWKRVAVVLDYYRVGVFIGGILRFHFR